MHDVENDELRAALRQCLRGYSDLLTVARNVLQHVEDGVPLAADSLALHREKFDSRETYLRRMQAMLDAVGVAPSLEMH